MHLKSWVDHYLWSLNRFKSWTCTSRVYQPCQVLNSYRLLSLIYRMYFIHVWSSFSARYSILGGLLYSVKNVISLPYFLIVMIVLIYVDWYYFHILDWHFKKIQSSKSPRNYRARAIIICCATCCAIYCAIFLCQNLVPYSGAIYNDLAPFLMILRHF